MRVSPVSESVMWPLIVTDPRWADKVAAEMHRRISKVRNLFTLSVLDNVLEGLDLQEFALIIIGIDGFLAAELVVLELLVGE